MSCTWSFICNRPYYIWCKRLTRTRYNDEKVVLWISELLNGSTLTVRERCSSQSYSSSLTAFWIMEIIVLLSLSVRPFDIGWYGIVRVYTISTISQIAFNVLLANNNLTFICGYMITSLPSLAHCSFDLKKGKYL